MKEKDDKLRLVKKILVNDEIIPTASKDYALGETNKPMGMGERRSRKVSY